MTRGYVIIADGNNVLHFVFGNSDMYFSSEGFGKIVLDDFAENGTIEKSLSEIKKVFPEGKAKKYKPTIINGVVAESVSYSYLYDVKKKSLSIFYAENKIVEIKDNVEKKDIIQRFEVAHDNFVLLDYMLYNDKYRFDMIEKDFPTAKTMSMIARKIKNKDVNFETVNAIRNYAEQAYGKLFLEKAGIDIYSRGEKKVYQYYLKYYAKDNEDDFKIVTLAKFAIGDTGMPGYDCCWESLVILPFCRICFIFDSDKHQTDNVMLRKTCQEIKNISIEEWMGFKKICDMYQDFEKEKDVQKRELIRKEIKDFYHSEEAFYNARGYLLKDNILNELSKYDEKEQKNAGRNSDG